MIWVIVFGVVAANLLLAYVPIVLIVNRNLRGEPIRNPFRSGNPFRVVGSLIWWSGASLVAVVVERFAARWIARHKARELLLEHLTPRQRELYTRYGFFYVRAADGQVYLLHKGWAHWLVKDGTPVTRFNGGIPKYHGFPREDRILAQLLMLRTGVHIPACHWGAKPMVPNVYDPAKDNPDFVR